MINAAKTKYRQNIEPSQGVREDGPKERVLGWSGENSICGCFLHLAIFPSTAAVYLYTID